MPTAVSGQAMSVPSPVAIATGWPTGTRPPRFANDTSGSAGRTTASGAVRGASIENVGRFVAGPVRGPSTECCGSSLGR